MNEYVALGKPCRPFKPQFLHLQNGNKEAFCKGLLMLRRQGRGALGSLGHTAGLVCAGQPGFVV